MSRACAGAKGYSIQLAEAWRGEDGLMVMVTMVLGNTTHLPGTYLYK